MTYYMPQHVFNGVALSIALGRFVGQNNPAEAQAIIAEGLQTYSNFYTQDDFLPEAEDCATRTLDWLREQAKDDPKVTFALLAALNDAVLKYQPNGDKKPWRLFNGMKLSAF